MEDPLYSSDAQLTQFTMFSILPYDIRYMIWSYAALYPRSIVLFFDDLHFSEDLLRAAYANPGILHACRLSREIAIQASKQDLQIFLQV